MVLWGAVGHAQDAAPKAEGDAAVEDVDLAAAKKIFTRSCRACHGNQAQGAASYPSLADKEPAYIVERLERYREGEKIGPNSILMIQHAKKLSDSDIASLAVYVTTAFN
ncbi:c-type cytochrome [Ponticoccus alexandrii]|uniref:C-type cytochrome n=1 Tax=Ponticoccus alexandrii TaxID=1943633 RepID=A0ABX7FIP6_9RHOB|nr:c-type cytochrome [Ponticoccus alexandrii]QRF69207.1 c-type cytochrome [Ponticoccus alexandrii]